MASVYARGGKWWARLKGVKVPGKWASVPTPFGTSDPADKRKAKRYAEAAQRKIDARTDGAPTPIGTLTVRKYIATWLEKRRESGHDWKQDKGRLEKHVLPAIGDLVLANVRTVHIADLVHRLRFKSDPRLANRTVRNIYSVVAAALRDAAIDGLLDTNPCILTDAQLGPVVDKDPEWRAGAFFTRDEAEALISDPRIPFDRQMVYGFGVLAGLRPGEAAALRWKHYDASAEPLGRLTVAKSYNTKRAITKGTKTEAVKFVPVHPTLAAMLADWKLTGWAAMMGRQPTPDDLIVPLPPDTIAKRTKRAAIEPFRGYDYSGKRWREVDLPMLGWRARSLYDTRATFITLACDEDGADRDVIRTRVTHTPAKRDAFDGYARGTRWRETCDEVAKLQLVRKHRPTGVVVALEAAEEGFATALATAGDFESDVAALLGSGGGFRTLSRRRETIKSRVALQESRRVSSNRHPDSSGLIRLDLGRRGKILPRPGAA